MVGLRVLAWKEVLETVRDRRTLGLMALSAMLLPVLGLLVSGLRAQQQAIVVVSLCDNGVEARVLASMLVEELSKAPGLKPIETRCSLPSGYVFAVLIPSGFTDNATSIGKPVVVKYYRLVGSVAASQAESIVNNVLYEYSDRLARRRVSAIASMAGVKVDPGLVLHPVRVVSETVTATGAPAAPALEARASVARFLSFAVFLVLNPAAVAVVDALVGERERGTAEMLAASPLRPRELVAGKMVGGIVLALMAAGIDALAVVAYMLLVGGGLELQGLGPDLAAVHALETLLAVAVTAALSAPIAVRAPTPRSATMGALIVTGLATGIFFASFFVDFDRLPPALEAALYTIPYTHVALAIYSYALGDRIRSLLHSLAVVAVTLAAVALASKLYSPESYVRQV